MNVIATGAAEGLPRRSFAVAEIRRMVEAGIIAEDENFELIEGEVVARFPKGNAHEIIKAALIKIFAFAASDTLRSRLRQQSTSTSAPSSNPTSASTTSG